jgi:ADP-ribose pyrophosphatase
MGDPEAWLETGRQPVVDCGIFAVERSHARSPVDGSEHAFYRILSVDWVQLVPVTADGDLVMIRQYRHGTRHMTLEIPGGLIDAGESPAHAAARECLEETGYRAGDVQPLGVLQPNPALFSNRLHGFFAEGVECIAEIENTGRERTLLELVPLSDLPRLLTTGVIDHALVVATLWRYLYRHLR